MRKLLLIYFLVSSFLFALPVGELPGLKIVTYNIWHGLDSSHASIAYFPVDGGSDQHLRRIDRLLHYLKKNVDPDVLFVQEANPLPNLARYMGMVLDMDYIYLNANCGIKVFNFGIPWNLREGLVIFAKKKLKLKKVKNIFLSGSSGAGDFFCYQTSESRWALHGTIEFHGKKIQVINTHLHHLLGPDQNIVGSLEEMKARKVISLQEYQESLKALQIAQQKRIDELAVLGDNLRQLKGPVIFGGDFNASPGSKEVSFVKSLGFQTPFPMEGKFTWDPQKNSLTKKQVEPLKKTYSPLEKILYPTEFGLWLDYIFVRGMEASQPRMLGLEGARDFRLSDHYGLFLQLK